MHGSAIQRDAHTHDLSTFRELRWATGADTASDSARRKRYAAVRVLLPEHVTGLRFPREKAGKGRGTAPRRAQHVQRPRDRSVTSEELRNRSVHRLRWAGQGVARAGKVGTGEGTGEGFTGHFQVESLL